MNRPAEEALPGDASQLYDQLTGSYNPSNLHFQVRIMPQHFAFAFMAGLLLIGKRRLRSHKVYIFSRCHIFNQVIGLKDKRNIFFAADQADVLFHLKNGNLIMEKR